MIGILKWVLRPLFIVFAGASAVAAAPIVAIIGLLTSILFLVSLILDIVYTLTHWA